MTGLWNGKKRWVFITAIFVLALITISGCGSTTVKPQDSLEAFTAYLDRRAPRLIERYDVPGMTIALVRGGELVWSGAYGSADLDQQREMTVETIFRVESISKSVSAWGITRLSEKELIDLDAPVQQYLGGWQMADTPFNEQAVTPRKLLNNNAGMPLGEIGRQYSPLGEVPSLREYLTKEAKLIKEPGTGFLYANTGYNLMELLVEEVTSRDFALYMAEDVLEPLGMRHSSYDWDVSFNAAIATGYDLKGKAVPLYVYPARASGGLFATVEDIARFAIAGMSAPYAPIQNVLAPDSIREIHTPRVKISGIYGVVADDYGYGHFIESLPDGRKAVWHGGQGNGWMTHFHLVPESGDAIIILTNSQRSWPVMAQILTSWARWNGFGSVKMGLISHGITATWVLISLMAMASLWTLYSLVIGLREGCRRFAPLSSDSRLKRWLQIGFHSAVIAGLVWSAAQPYLIISSILPGVADWAGISVFILSSIRILSALFPRRAE